MNVLVVPYKNFGAFFENLLVNMGILVGKCLAPEKKNLEHN